MTDSAYFVYGFSGHKVFGLIVRTHRECCGMQASYRSRGFKVFWRRV